MLSVEQTKFQHQYGYRNGMRNVAWIAGILRNPQSSHGFIQQTNNLNQMVHFVCEPGVVIPGDYTDGQPIKIIARVLSGISNERPTLKLVVKKFERPSILDMPARKAWEQATRPGVPVDPATPETVREDRLDGWRVEDTGNMSKIAGFIAGFHFEASKEPGGGCVEVFIRQTKDDTDLLPVRHYGAQAGSVARKLQVGMPLLCQGRISVAIKNTGEPAGEDGILPTHKTQYLRVQTFNTPGRTDIEWVKYPDWVDQMMLDAHSARQKRIEARQNKQAEVAAAEVAETSSPVTQVTQTVALATASAPSGTQEIPADIQMFLASKKT